MRKATRIVAASLGVLAGIGGPEHGYFEILQGHVRPDSFMIAAMGPPCEPDKVWNLCEPAMTVVPSFLVTGILATLLGIITMIWAAAFVHKKGGGLVLILLSIALLLVGGGLFPPVIGIVGGVVATRINAPLNRQPERRSGRVSRFFARLWPWPLVAFFAWLFGQFVVGYFFNEFLLKSGFLIPLLILGLMILAIVSGFAHDAQRQAD
jgi:MFS family permease